MNPHLPYAYAIWHMGFQHVHSISYSHTMSCGKKRIGGSALAMAGHWSTLVLHSSWLVPTGEQFTWRVHLWRGKGEGGEWGGEQGGEEEEGWGDGKEGRKGRWKRRKEGEGGLTNVPPFLPFQDQIYILITVILCVV